MKPSNRRMRLGFPGLVAWAAIAAFGALATECAGDEAGDELAYPTVGADLEPLRSAFNADPGHVRAILLASPT